MKALFNPQTNPTLVLIPTIQLFINLEPSVSAEYECYKKYECCVNKTIFSLLFLVFKFSSFSNFSFEYWNLVNMK